MTDHDKLMKALLTTFFVEFLEAFFPAILEYLDGSTIQFMPQEVFTDPVSGKKYVADILIKANFKGNNAWTRSNRRNWT